MMRLTLEHLGLAGVGVGALFALALALCWVCVRHLDPAFAPSADVALAEQTTSASVMLNAIPATLIAILLLALTRRGLASLSVVVPLLLALYTANEVKLVLLDTPLLPGDFQLLAHLGDSGALLARYLTSWQWAWVIGVATIWLLLLLFERPWSALRGHRRLTILILAPLRPPSSSSASGSTCRSVRCVRRASSDGRPRAHGGRSSRSGW